MLNWIKSLMNRTKTQQEVINETYNQIAQQQGSINHQQSLSVQQSIVTSQALHTIQQQIAQQMYTQSANSKPLQGGLVYGAGGLGQYGYYPTWQLPIENKAKAEYETFPGYIKSFVEEVSSTINIYTYEKQVEIANIFQKHTANIKFENKLDEVLKDE